MTMEMARRVKLWRGEVALLEALLLVEFCHPFLLLTCGHHGRRELKRTLAVMEVCAAAPRGGDAGVAPVDARDQHGGPGAPALCLI
jgi:hypothetical protein